MRCILARQTFARVENENHDVAFGDRLLGLRGHFAHDAFRVDRLESAGVDGDVVARPDAAFAVVPVARQARKIGHQSRRACASVD